MGDVALGAEGEVAAGGAVLAIWVGPWPPERRPGVGRGFLSPPVRRRVSSVRELEAAGVKEMLGTSVPHAPSRPLPFPCHPAGLGGPTRT